MPDEVLVSGTTFLIADAAGNIVEGGLAGLYRDDTRHLSRWELLVDGAAPRLLSTDRDLHGARYVLVPVTPRGEDPACTLVRTQALDDALFEELRLVNHRTEELYVRVAYRTAADFADQFELRSSARFDKPQARWGSDAEADGMSFHYRRGDYAKDTVITSHPAPDRAGDELLECELRLPPGGVAKLRVTVGAHRIEPQPPAVLAERYRADARDFLDGAHLPDGAGSDLVACARQGLTDLAGMRVAAPGRPDLRVPGAGVPWFLTLFGRDSLITSLSVLGYRPELAAHTLRALARTQGTVIDPERIEEPGKIVHEVRCGELSRFGQVPFERYYGTVDATPLFLVLLTEYWKATGDEALVRELEPVARAALDWMHAYGGLDEHGYLVYRTDVPGLVHQCWKDSPRGVCFFGGEPAEGPISTCEVQGYAYRALRGCARLAREVWEDNHRAERWDARADRLRTEFHTDFWLDEAGFVALALDGRRARVDALASNAGHVLWSGILDDDRARVVGRRLTDEEFFSGWGLRTLASGQPAYHPVSYHNGSVWPHDTAIAVAGLARYGQHDEARTLADALGAAGREHGYRLPEVMAGFSRAELGVPVPYPHSCSPQAWAAAAPLLVLSALEPARRPPPGQ